MSASSNPLLIDCIVSRIFSGGQISEISLKVSSRDRKLAVKKFWHHSRDTKIIAANVLRVRRFRHVLRRKPPVTSLLDGGREITAN